MGSASFMQEIELFLSRPGSQNKAPRIGMTTVCTASAMVSVGLGLHWPSVLGAAGLVGSFGRLGSRLLCRQVGSPVPLRKTRRDNLAAHRIARLGSFLTSTRRRTQVQCSQIAE